MGSMYFDCDDVRACDYRLPLALPTVMPNKSVMRTVATLIGIKVLHMLIVPFVLLPVLQDRFWPPLSGKHGTCLPDPKKLLTSYGLPIFGLVDC